MSTASNGRQRSVAVTWIFSLALLAPLVTLMYCFSYAAACFDEHFRGGDWLDLGALVLFFFLFPPLGAGCCILALILLRRGTHRPLAVCALAIALPLGFPLTSLVLAKGLSAPAAWLWQPHKDALDRAQFEQWPKIQVQDLRMDAMVRHYDALTAQFAMPQVVSHAEQGRILLLDHKIVSLYGIHYSREMDADLIAYVSQNLTNKHVVIRLPNREEFLKSYSPGIYGDSPVEFKPVYFALSPKDASGWHYGTIPCLVYVDGRLLNSRYKGTPGSLADFSEYEMPKQEP